MTRLIGLFACTLLLCASAVAQPAPLIISEFRLFGPAGSNDEFIELYNNSGADLLVSTTDGSAGYALAASDGSVRFVIPNGTLIPVCSHFLIANSTNPGGYSLSAYPAGTGTTATPDATYTSGIPDTAGLALFNTANPGNFSTSTRLDAVGPTSAPALYKEDPGYPPLSVLFVEHSLYRDLTSGKPVDTDKNEDDFFLVDTNATTMCTPTPNSHFACQRLGAPGPENLSSPIYCHTFKAAFIAPCLPSSAPPNRIITNNPHTLSIRRKFTNIGPAATRLRFRIVDLTTLPAPTASTAILTATTSSTSTESNSCTGGMVVIQGLTLEMPPMRPLDGGFNSSLSVTLSTPLATGASINVNFLLNIVQGGSFRFYVITEALP